MDQFEKRNFHFFLVFLNLKLNILFKSKQHSDNSGGKQTKEMLRVEKEENSIFT